MRRRVGSIIVATLLVVAVACGGDDDDEPAASSVPPTTAHSGTTALTSDTTQPADTTGTTSSTEPPIPPPTPPPGQPAACSLLGESALVAVGVPPGTQGVEDAGPGNVAPSTSCHWEGSPGVSVALFYGMDPLEILATARQLAPGGVDVTGLGQDGYFVTGTLFVDAGSQAFAISGGPTQEQLVTLAQYVLSNL
jgi:hypothetical protein